VKYSVVLHVNGISYDEEIDPHRSLLSVLRGELGLTGTKEGCDDSECGACIVLVEGRPVNSCSYLALQAHERRVETVEGLGSTGRLHVLQQAFLEDGGVQCGFCTPGMLMSSKALLDQIPDPTEQDVKRYLAGNLCRCTGYAGIIRAVLSAAAAARTDPAADR
jgi:aerobic-type carbon monoxide dehydrogenase small subunit (CoxS/CutS family)